MRGRVPTQKPEGTPLIVGIDLYDNDFSNTIRPFLEMLLQYRWRENEVFTKEQVVKLWNTACSSIYLLCQNRFRPGAAPDLEHIHKYLQIPESRVERCVFVGEDEVLKHYYELSDKQNGNMEYFFTLDGKEVHCL